MQKNVDYALIGSRIKEARREQKMTQEKLAEALDVSVGYVSQVERGITKISLDLLGAISGILNRDVAWFISRAGFQSTHYLEAELEREFSSLSVSDKQLVLGIISLLKNRA